ncbi:MULTISPECIES: 50S ribosomal protein L30 [Anaerotruncus]|uniref:Large ribosomal subunit protein uL30 n=2 Tax=Anaerotruncus TaxID=244127 RepID=A0A498CPN0_9FIRM|nr:MULTISPECIES: 50S ribosomal protein L30 [Anaerotruncus]MBC3939360.1 50S ribosomal protein L30 [Anaerotruncus massiliensis (ex Togo et al. 2019)]MCQ4896348.1 50S ribosomal protein L30 [Anaerotruncus sp. DFI.9.16]RLL09541.1 50S ribosomal protein L30 [Anaerotruncus massiliensis (ex Liu et al. 2021)]GKH48681.1 50S ribosomal protein L30 [Oscillospiraceae bacterium]
MALTIKLVKSLVGRKDDQIATAESLGLRRIGDTTTQPDNDATKGKITKISHLIEVTNA